MFGRRQALRDDAAAIGPETVQPPPPGPQMWDWALLAGVVALTAVEAAPRADVRVGSLVGRHHRCRDADPGVAAFPSVGDGRARVRWLDSGRRPPRGSWRRVGCSFPTAWATRAVSLADCDVTHDNLRTLATMMASGDLRAIVDEVYPLARTTDAVARMLRHRVRGKVIVTVEAWRWAINERGSLPRTVPRGRSTRAA